MKDQRAGENIPRRQTLSRIMRARLARIRESKRISSILPPHRKGQSPKAEISGEEKKAHVPKATRLVIRHRRLPALRQGGFQASFSEQSSPDRQRGARSFWEESKRGPEKEKSQGKIPRKNLKEKSFR